MTTKIEPLTVLIGGDPEAEALAARYRSKTCVVTTKVQLASRAHRLLVHTTATRLHEVASSAITANQAHRLLGLSIREGVLSRWMSGRLLLEVNASLVRCQVQFGLAKSDTVRLRPPMLP